MEKNEQPVGWAQPTKNKETKGQEAGFARKLKKLSFGKKKVF